MIDLLSIIKVMACAGIFWRIYTYHWPKESTYRIWVTSVAYILMLMVGGQAIAIIIGAPRIAAIFDSGVYLGFLALVMTARGNVADILKVDYNWSGSERRRGRT